MPDNNDAIFAEIREVLEANGSISDQTRSRLTLASIAAVYQRLTIVSDNTKRIETLERNNILMWIRAHPVASVFIAVCYLLLTNAEPILRFLAQVKGYLP